MARALDRAAVFSASVLLCVAGCSSSGSNGSEGAGPRLATGGNAGFGSNATGGQADPIFSPGGGTGSPLTAVPIPTDFVPAEIGGYKLGESITAETPNGSGSTGKDGGTGCDVVVGVVRDFKGINEDMGHPDFEAFDGKGVTPGLMGAALGDDQKPVYSSLCELMPDKTACPYGQMTTSRADFDEWYRFTDGVNRPYLLYLLFAANGGVFTFSSKAFFPLDGAGWGNSPHKSHHNFGFTTEIHTAFEYRGGEEFTFTGDDDVWIFVNRKLAIDLGGLHPPKSQTLNLDSLGLIPGTQYPFDLFHAERHSASSNFRVDTTLTFSNCGTFVPERIR
jgi:fibro-slime domain-containing protein